MLAKKKKGNNQVSATVADNHLVLSLPNAVEPIIWRKSLDKIGSATFEVKKSTTKGQYNLTLKKTKTTSETIAKFDNKDDAFAALNAASEAFHGNNITPKAQRSVNTNQQQVEYHAPKDSGGKKWLLVLIAALLVIGLYIYMGKIMPTQQIITNTSSTPATNSSVPAADTTGVPVSADDFFNSVQ